MTNKYQIDEKKIDKLAYLAIKRGVGLQKGQNLLITSSIEALPLVRKIAEYAYKEGAGLVTPLFSDPKITLSRFKFADDDSFNVAANWLYSGMSEAFDNNTARLAIAGDDPMLLSDMDIDKVSRVNKANAIAYKPARERITQFNINWNIVSWPGKAWAKRVFPNLIEKEAVLKLADAIFDASRISVEDPIQAWDEHNKSLKLRTNSLNKHNFQYLKYTGPNTDLKIGLADGHEWIGGASVAQNGITCNPNIPSEEVFTTPHAFKTEGRVSSTKPLSYQGSLIDEIQVVFKEGKIIESKASKGSKIFEKILNSDEGARRIGEVALVPDSSPISKSGLIFFNTLFDENAASHIALGQCYSKCFKGKSNLSAGEISKKGGNSSMIHIDWMIGSKEIDVDGINSNGDIIPVFRKGEWTII